MATSNGSAEIVNMEDARARRRASELDGGEFASAGAHLKAVREASGLSLDEVSERTHIKAAYLAAIEEMRPEHLPSRPFAIGFARVYAEAMGLDANAVIARFKDETGFSGAVEIESEKFEAAQAAVATDRPHMSLIAFIAILFFILWCAHEITRPRPEETPYRLNGAASATEAATNPAARQPEAETGQGIGQRPAPNDIAPQLVSQIEPVYPPSCEAGAELVETVDLAFNVSAEGLVGGERVVASTNPCFREAALNALRRWKYAPRTVDG
ncbi:MAG TPA: helix-turn-helix domain-containing protein, partial [Parvularculaceae bacterium]|nr:helix-turn-helix domain-containing protein [Parvularculaceae bacterium]